MTDSGSFAAFSLIALLTFGCSNVAPASEYTNQAVQESNVAQLLTEAQTTQQVDSLFLQANSLLNAHSYKNAIETYDKVLKIRPNKAEAWISTLR